MSVDCCISSLLRLIATSLLCCNPSRCLSTPSPSLVAVTPPGRRYCVVHVWHFESRLLRFSTRPILPLMIVVYLPLALCLAFISQPTVLPMQLLPAPKTNAICVGLVLVPPPPISSIPTSSVAGHRRSLPSRSPSLAICLIVRSSLLSTSLPDIAGINMTLDPVGCRRTAPCRRPTTHQCSRSCQERRCHNSRIIK